jgi:hypothetical protein
LIVQRLDAVALSVLALPGVAFVLVLPALYVDDRPYC